jgi:mycothiol synthase
MTVLLPAAPPIDGLRFRRIERPADEALLADLLNMCFKADGIEFRLSTEQIGLWLDHPSRMDPAEDLLLAEVDGLLVAYAEAGWEQDNDGGRNYTVWGQVDPAWRRRGLGAALLAWNETRQQEVAAAHPADIDRRLQGWANEGEIGRIALLERNGYQVVRYGFEMERAALDDLPQVTLPDGLEIRPARESDLRRVWELEVEVFRDHFGAIDDTEDAFERLRTDPTRDISLWVLVWHGEELVGQVLNRINAAANAEMGLLRGRVNSVGVRRAWRRRGLAYAMVVASLTILRDAGMTSASLGVDAENPHGALGIYERAGFAVARRERVYRKPL